MKTFRSRRQSAVAVQLIAAQAHTAQSFTQLPGLTMKLTSFLMVFANRSQVRGRVHKVSQRYSAQPTDYSIANS